MNLLSRLSRSRIESPRSEVVTVVPAVVESPDSSVDQERNSIAVMDRMTTLSDQLSSLLVEFDNRGDRRDE